MCRRGYNKSAGCIKQPCLSGRSCLLYTAQFHIFSEGCFSVMKIIKRNGSEAAFDISKIIVAIGKANATVDESIRMTPVQIQRIAESVVLSCERLGRSPSVEEVQDMVEKQIMAHGAFEVAKNYITYRYTRTLVRQSNTTDDKILSLIECNNEEAKQENSNKNPVVNSTQRDYMAGEVSRDITNRILLPK